ncbi:MAG: FKBP-type peptidyl-prolyl cis-trans isomerase [Bdellovibrionales bacterium]|nr:FKBP-type peptidyl-prolyl cis-trans isomerase [Bdellovibrionales bacterium]
MEVATESPRVVTPGAELSLHYTLSTEDEIFDTTEGLEPLQIRLGTGRLNAVVESCLLGLREGEEFYRVLDPSITFGERNSELRMTLDRAGLPERVKNLQVGDSFEGPGPDRKVHIFRVIRANELSFTVDGNHPLAGIPLIFEGRVLKIIS